MEFSQREPQHVTFATNLKEARGTHHGFARFDRSQRSPERKRIIGLDGRKTFAREPEAGKDRLGQSNRIVQTSKIVAWLGAQYHTHGCGTVGECGRSLRDRSASPR